MTMFFPSRMGVGRSTAAYTAQAAEFTASTDSMSNTSFTFGGSPDYKKGILSVWLYFPSSIPNGGTVLDIRNGGTQEVVVQSLSSDRMYLMVKSDLAIMSYATPASGVSADTWFWLGASWDSSVPKSRFCINGTVYTPTQPTLDAALPSLTRVYVPTSGGMGATVYMSDLYFAFGQYLDFDTQSNREKFRSAAGKPVNLGTDGSTPTGSVPHGFFRFLDPTNSTQSNSSGGSSLTVTGSLSAVSGP